jgi:hypothetical protein
LLLYRLSCLEYYYYQELLSLILDPGNTSPIKQNEDIYETRCYCSIQSYPYYRRQEYLIAFNIHYGLYETLVILFGLSNAPAIF